MQGALQNVAGLSFSMDSAIRLWFVVSLQSQIIWYSRWCIVFSWYVECWTMLKGPASVLYGRGSAGGLKLIKNQWMNLCVKWAWLVRSTSCRSWCEWKSSRECCLTGAVEDSDGYRDQAFLRRWLHRWSGILAIKLNFYWLFTRWPFSWSRFPDRSSKPVKTNPKTFYGALNGKGMLTLKSQVKLSA